MSKTNAMKKNKITQTILAGAVAMLGTTGNAQQATSVADKTVDPPALSEIRPFHVHFSDAALADLRRRVLATKWPDRELVKDETQGVQLATMQALAKYWTTAYDWRKVEARLNALPQFITTIDGLDIHFIWVRSKEKNALPMEERLKTLLTWSSLRCPATAFRVSLPIWDGIPSVLPRRGSC